MRTFPDGFFDGVVELRDGNNLIRFTAVAKSGSVDDIERIVRFHNPGELSREEQERRAQELELLAESLRERTAETEFLAEMAKRRPPEPGAAARGPDQERVIDLRAQRKPRPAPAPVSSSPPVSEAP